MNVTYRCEHDFWGDKYRLNLDEPVAALSGLVMCVMALLGNASVEDPPLQFCIACASLVVCGLGTFVFHAFDVENVDALHLNGNIFDGVSMAMVTVNVFLLHLNDWMKLHLMAVSVGA